MSIVTSAEARPVLKEKPLRNDASGRWYKRASALTSVSCEDTEKMRISSADSGAPWSSAAGSAGSRASL